MGYLDDIIIYSRTEKEHLEHLEEIFNRLRAAGLKLKLEKCSETISWTGRLLQKICPQIYKHFKSLNTSNKEGCGIQMGP